MHCRRVATLSALSDRTAWAKSRTAIAKMSGARSGDFVHLTAAPNAETTAIV
jgi:hypothetical protein